MPDDGWRKLNRGLFDSADGQWRIANPYKLTTELRHRWLIAQRRSSGAGWNMHDGDHATQHVARAYVAALSNAAPPPSDRTHDHEPRGEEETEAR
jgi:hypothetical protein